MSENGRDDDWTVGFLESPLAEPFPGTQRVLRRPAIPLMVAATASVDFRRVFAGALAAQHVHLDQVHVESVTHSSRLAITAGVILETCYGLISSIDTNFGLREFSLLQHAKDFAARN